MQSAKQATKQIKKATEAAAKKKKRSRWPIIAAIIVVVAVVALIVGLNAAGGSADPEPMQEPENSAAEDARAEAETTGDNPVIEIVMADGGTIDIELDPTAAPITVANFLKLVDQNYYDGLTFHRIADWGVIQGGCPEGTGMGGPDERIYGEFAENGWDNPISHERGVISMARSGDPDSAGSQFFITFDDVSYSLDYKYATFGRVLSGMEVVDAISMLPKDGETPLEPPVIQTIRRV